MQKNSKRKILIVDGSHYLYRAYYGVPGSAKLPSGLQVNAVYGFMAYFRKVVKYILPTSISVIFDSETGTKKKVEEDDTYKANRDYSDTGMYKQLPIIKKLLDYLKIKYVEPDNHEADDYIGSLAHAFSKEGVLSYVFSNDADFLQIINKNIFVIKMGQKTPEIIDSDTLKAKYGFNSALYLDFLSLKGDSSDNIKGVKGVGFKTAQGFITKFGGIDNIYKNIDQIQERYKKLLQEDKKIVYKNKKFLKIDIDALSSPFPDIEEINLEKLDELAQPTNYLLNKIGISTK